MLIVQCNCKNSRRITGSINVGCFYAETEVEFMGEASVSDFAGGSGFINEAYFCPKSHIRVYNKSALEVIEGMISTLLGCFKTTNDLVPKVKIFSDE